MTDVNLSRLAGTPVKVIKFPVRVPPLKDAGPHGGREFESPSGRFEVYGEILKKYLSFGGTTSVLAFPVGEESGCPDGVGRFQHFQGGSIYWTPATGAHVVYGAIRDRWSSIGWERSYLGYPLTDEIDFDGGRMNQFQGGQIYWWPDTGAIDLHEVVLHYTGMICWHESDHDQSSDSDEPYAIFGVVAPDSTSTVHTRIYDDVDTGESRPDLLELYRGKPGGLVVTTTMWENDFGNPDQYEPSIKNAIDEAAKDAGPYVSKIPYVGLVFAALLPFVPKVSGAIATGVGKLLNLQDDNAGHAEVAFSPKEMIVKSARDQNQWQQGIGYKASTGRITHDGGYSYEVFFGFVPA
ncbi:LGFP repeat-containing protein [Rathayibacter sp. CAU 1779]